MSGTVALNWPTAALGDLVIAKYGKGLSQAKRRGGPIPVFGSNGVVGHHDEAITGGPTIIIGRKGSLGAVNFSATACWPIDTTYYIDEPGPFSLEFLELVLRSLGLEELDRSTAIPGLSRDDLYAIEVPVPPMGVQNHLVTIVARSTELGTSAQDHLATARGAIERFRRSVLAAACSGRLTADWRLRQGIIDSKGEELPGGWSRRTLDELGKWRTGGTPSRKRPEYFGGSIPWVKSGDLRDGPVRSTQELLTLEGLNNSSAKLMPAGTVSIALYGATIGRLGVFEIDAATNQACANCELDEMMADRWFLFYFLLAQRPKLIAAGQGGAQPNLTNRIVRDWPIVLPPLAEQREIVRCVEGLLNLGTGLEQRIDAARRHVERAPRVVLAKALRGDLPVNGETGGDLETRVLQEN